MRRRMGWWGCQSRSGVRSIVGKRKEERIHHYDRVTEGWRVGHEWTMGWSGERRERLGSLVMASHHNRALRTARNPQSPAIDRPVLQEPPVFVLNCLSYQSHRLLRQSRSRSPWEFQTQHRSPRREGTLSYNE